MGGFYPENKDQMMTEVIDGVLFRSSRPGYRSELVGEPEVKIWVGEAQRLGIKTILCLLDGEQLPFYSRIPGGLLEYYRRSGFRVIHRPVKDHQTPAVPEEVLVQSLQDLNESPRPMLVHCSAGLGRTGAVTRFLLDNRGLINPEVGTKMG